MHKFFNIDIFTGGRCVRIGSVIWVVCYISVYSTNNICIFLNFINQRTVIGFASLKWLAWLVGLRAVRSLLYCSIIAFFRVMFFTVKGTAVERLQRRTGLLSVKRILAVLKELRHIGRFPCRVRNGDKCYRNVLGKFPENPEIAEFPKANHSTKNSDYSGAK